ncbi:hypothetical protein [Halomicrococcus sp. SG-WS-1]|uniref:hypothetical protein n=1 Tax=Halomicrococcus sp. SG-WS-1 TaxID=3439057 RepID=UPI003F7A06F2
MLMESATVDAAIDDLRGHFTTFLEQLSAQVDDQTLEAIVEEDESLQSDVLGQMRERFVEDTLIWPMLETLGYQYTPRPYYPAGDDGECPDFRIDNLSDDVIGENKALHAYGDAASDIELYLDSQRYDYGIATDGLTWGVYEIVATDGKHVECQAVVDEHDLQPVFQQLARQNDLINYTDQLQSEQSVDGQLGDFYRTFSHETIRREIGGLSRFYDKYIELIDGEGEYNDFEENLVAAIDAPSDADRGDRLAFAGLLIDRLAFVQLLLDREVLALRSLQTYWDEHTTGLNRFQGSFYSQYLSPLFYDILGTPVGVRDTDGEATFGQPPHLNGGLFETLLPDERAYDVPDPVMQTVLLRLIEGERRTIINQAVEGSLLESYTDVGSLDIAGETARWYGDITTAYDNSVDYVETEIETTLRSFT